MNTAYRDALVAAGAQVEDYATFGSPYDGIWVAKLPNGWILDGYGSCSGCDAYESEFVLQDPTPERLAAFGQRYLLTGLLSNEQFLALLHEREYRSDYPDLVAMAARHGLHPKEA